MIIKTRRRATPDNAERGFNLGNPTVLAENYQVDPYDKNRPLQEADILQLLDLSTLH